MRNFTYSNLRNLTLTTFLGATSLSSYTNALENLANKDLTMTMTTQKSDAQEITEVVAGCCKTGIEIIKAIKPDMAVPLQKISGIIDNAEVIVGRIEHLKGTIENLKSDPKITPLSQAAEIIKGSKDITDDLIKSILPTTLYDASTVSNKTLQKKINQQEQPIAFELIQIDHSVVKQKEHLLTKKAVKNANKHLNRRNHEIIADVVKIQEAQEAKKAENNRPPA